MLSLNIISPPYLKIGTNFQALQTIFHQLSTCFPFQLSPAPVLDSIGVPGHNGIPAPCPNVLNTALAAIFQGMLSGVAFYFSSRNKEAGLI